MRELMNHDHHSVLQVSASKVRITRCLALIVVLLHLGNAAALWVKYRTEDFLFRDPIIELFRVSSEGKIPTWYSSCTLLLCSLLLVIISIGKWRVRDRYGAHWIGLAVIFALMSLDEATAIHEMSNPSIRDALSASGVFYYSWVIPAVALMAVFVVVYLKFTFALPKRSI